MSQVVFPFEDLIVLSSCVFIKVFVEFLFVNVYLHFAFVAIVVFLLRHFFCIVTLFVYVLEHL